MVSVLHQRRIAPGDGEALVIAAGAWWLLRPPHAAFLNILRSL